MNYDWDDDELMPDDGDYGITIGEAARDVAVFLAKVLGLVLATAAIIALFAYGIWRELLVIGFLTR